MHLQVSNPRVVVSSSSNQNGDFLAPSTTSFTSSTSPEAPLTDLLVELLIAFCKGYSPAILHKSTAYCEQAQSTSTVIVDDNDTGDRLGKKKGRGKEFVRAGWCCKKDPRHLKAQS